MPLIDLPASIVDEARSTTLADCSVGRAFAAFVAIREAAIAGAVVDNDHDLTATDYSKCPRCVVDAICRGYDLTAATISAGRVEHTCGIW